MCNKDQNNRKTQECLWIPYFCNNNNNTDYDESLVTTVL